MLPGIFVIAEGIDACGKTTFINWLKENHHVEPQCVYTTEPGGGLGDISLKIRQLILKEGSAETDPLTMFNLFWASKAENAAKLVRPQMMAGKVVVSDRFDGSTYAFQIGENPRLKDLFWIMRDRCLEEIKPIYMFFDVDVKVAMERCDSRGDKSHFDERDCEYHTRVRNFYLEFFSDSRIKSVTVDANLSKEQMIASAYEIFKSIVKDIGRH